MKNHSTKSPPLFHLTTLAISIAAALAANSASAAVCPPDLTANTSTAQTVANATCTINATLNVSAASTAAVTLSGGTAQTPTTLVNNGTIQVSAVSKPGRAVESSGTNAVLVIQNNSGATISSNNNDTVAAGTGSTSVTSVSLSNAGTIVSAAGGQAVNFNKIKNGANSVTNSGTIQATGSDAVRPGVNGIVTNAGTIQAIPVSGSGSDGIDADVNTGINITNNAGGLIQGRHGIAADGTAGTPYTLSVTNNVGATIQAVDGSGINADAINGKQVVTINNSGKIIGNGITGDGDGVDVDGLVNLTNSGLIRSLNSVGSGSSIEVSEGVTVGGGSIINTGTIQGSIAAGNTTGVGRGITIAGVDKDSQKNPIPPQAPYAATTITNSGLIIGDSDSAIAFTSALSSGFAHTVSNLSGGILQGGGTVNAAIVTAADNVTINNAGKIDGSSSGKAIVGGSGNLTVNITGASASVLGDIHGGTGNNTLSISPGANNTFAYSGSISNFNSILVQSGDVTLSGVSTYSGATQISGGTLTLEGANRLSMSSALILAGGRLSLADAGGANGQTFASLSLTDNSSIDLALSSLSFGTLGSIGSGKHLTVLDWSQSASPDYAFRLAGDDTHSADFLALIAGTTIDGLAVTFKFDGQYTDVKPVPIPAAGVLLMSGLGLIAVLASRRRKLMPTGGAFGAAC